MAVTTAFVKSMLPLPPPASIRSWACCTFPNVMFALFHALKCWVMDIWPHCRAVFRTL